MNAQVKWKKQHSLERHAQQKVRFITPPPYLPFRSVLCSLFVVSSLLHYFLSLSLLLSFCFNLFYPLAVHRDQHVPRTQAGAISRRVRCHRRHCYPPVQLYMRATCAGATQRKCQGSQQKNGSWWIFLFNFTFLENFFSSLMRKSIPSWSSALRIFTFFFLAYLCL